MAYNIPRIQYKNADLTGSTVSGDGTLTSLDSTLEIEVGMFARGTGVPTGATVGTIGDTSVVLASGALCTATDSLVALSFGWEILFDYPPEEPTAGNLKTSATVSESLSGIRQVAVNYVEELRKLKFSFLSQTIYTQVDTFLRTWAMLGETFRYFEDQTSSSYVSYELDNLSVTPEKITGKGANAYVWRVPLNFRRAL